MDWNQSGDFLSNPFHMRSRVQMIGRNFPFFFPFFFEIQIFIAISELNLKMHKMSTNKPSFGSVVLEIAS